MRMSNRQGILIVFVTAYTVQVRVGPDEELLVWLLQFFLGAYKKTANAVLCLWFYNKRQRQRTGENNKHRTAYGWMMVVQWLSVNSLYTDQAQNMQGIVPRDCITLHEAQDNSAC